MSESRKCYLVTSQRRGLKTLDQVKAREMRIKKLRDKNFEKRDKIKDWIKKLQDRLHELENETFPESFGSSRTLEKLGADAISERIKDKYNDFGKYYVAYRINGKWYRQWHPIRKGSVDHNDTRLEEVD